MVIQSVATLLANRSVWPARAPLIVEYSPANEQAEIVTILPVLLIAALPEALVSVHGVGVGVGVGTIAVAVAVGVEVAVAVGVEVAVGVAVGVPAGVGVAVTKPSVWLGTQRRSAGWIGRFPVPN